MSIANLSRSVADGGGPPKKIYASTLDAVTVNTTNITNSGNVSFLNGACTSLNASSQLSAPVVECNTLSNFSGVSLGLQSVGNTTITAGTNTYQFTNNPQPTIKSNNSVILGGVCGYSGTFSGVTYSNNVNITVDPNPVCWWVRVSNMVIASVNFRYTITGAGVASFEFSTNEINLMSPVNFADSHQALGTMQPVLGFSNGGTIAPYYIGWLVQSVAGSTRVKLSCPQPFVGATSDNIVGCFFVIVSA